MHTHFVNSIHTYLDAVDQNHRSETFGYNILESATPTSF